MSEEELRMECLRLAVSHSQYEGGMDVLKLANDYYNFVIDKYSDNQSDESGRF